MALKDVTGKKFGKLLVLSLSSLHPYTKWLCRCDCGNEKVISASALRNGDTISCGCYKKSKERKLIGEKFGRLTVLSLASISPRKWLCRCDCGNETVVSGSGLCSGQSKSCGCYQKDRVLETCFIDLSGKKIGKLTVISCEGKHWKCQCDCGSILLVGGQNLREWRTQSCGCYHKEQTRKARLIDLIGKRFGKLEVLAEGDKRKKQIYWLCKCDCGKEKLIAGNSLSNGKSKSCGCGQGRIIHGKYGKSGYKRFFLSQDPVRKMQHYVGVSVRKALASRSIAKNRYRTFQHLPYTPSQLKEHLESLFEPWMNWHNYGGHITDPRKTWHIDHILPHSKFPYTSLEDPLFKECWALSNLRPLEKMENLLKGTK